MCNVLEYSCVYSHVYIHVRTQVRTRLRTHVYTHVYTHVLKCTSLHMPSSISMPHACLHVPDAYTPSPPSAAMSMHMCRAALCHAMPTHARLLHIPRHHVYLVLMPAADTHIRTNMFTHTYLHTCLLRISTYTCQCCLSHLFTSPCSNMPHTSACVRACVRFCSFIFFFLGGGGSTLLHFVGFGFPLEDFGFSVLVLCSAGSSVGPKAIGRRKAQGTNSPVGST